MKILAIRIKNLASLEGHTEIDFTKEPLCSAGIFAITGPTGAGKSTILDALCLALYAKTPRYLEAKEIGIDLTDVSGETISQNDIRGILRDGTSSGFAEVDFVAVDGQQYSASWHINRARNKADGTLQPYVIKLKNLNTNSDIPGKKVELLKEIARLVGLNFEQFTRSVLLAQGDFTAFLRAPKDAKSSLLEKLTGTQIYSEISQRIFENHRAETQKLQDLNIRTAGIPILKQDQLEDFTQQNNSIRKNITEQESKENSLNQEITWHNQFHSLKNHWEKALDIYNEASQKVTAAESRRQQLKQVESVQPSRSLILTLQKIEQDFNENRKAILEVQNTKKTLEEKREAQKTSLLLASQNLNTKDKAYEEAIPLLNKARALDEKISEWKIQVNNAMKDRDEAVEAKSQQELQLQQQQLEAKELLAQISALEKWRKEHNDQAPIAENQKLISSKLDDAQQLIDEVHHITTTIESCTKNIVYQNGVIAKLTEADTLISRNLHDAREAHKQIAEALLAYDMPALENENASLEQQWEVLLATEADWTILASKRLDFKHLSQKIAHNQAELEVSENALSETSERLNKIEIQQEASSNMLLKARMAAAENVVSLRQQLVEGDPCPVCGSETHPYGAHHPQLVHVLSQLESEHKKNELAYTECHSATIALKAKCMQLKKAIAEQNEESQLRASALAQLEQRWESRATKAQVKNLPEEEIATWIEAQLREKKDLKQHNRLRLQQFKTYQSQLDEKQRLIKKWEEEQNKKINQRKDAERELKSLEEQGQQQNNQLSKLNNQLLETEQMLNAYFPSADWFGRWKQDPKKFMTSINHFIVEWYAKMKTLGENVSNNDLLEATIKGTQERLENFETDCRRKVEKLESVSTQLAEFRGQRELIFLGEESTSVEKRLKKELAEAREAQVQNQQILSSLQESIQKIEGTKEQLEKHLSDLTLQKSEGKNKIQNWLLDFNKQNNSALEELELSELLKKSQDWLDGEQAFMKAVHDEFNQSLSVLTDRKSYLDEHEKKRISTRQPDELEQLLADIKRALNDSRETKNRIEYQLAQHKENKQRLDGLLVTINKQAELVENWAKLNEIIGSADGKKFRQVAQEYTLDILLGYTNVHLKMLSNRYVLQRIPNSLGLQVIDLDMGNDIRTVFSLSGGESFLVSLALALGLASLSSSRMQVESLFIDEGFGSLDPATFNIAMDALERLHNQGRKVGVISHVQEMAERIPVQIKVEKQHIGKSRVVIV